MVRDGNGNLRRVTKNEADLGLAWIGLVAIFALCWDALLLVTVWWWEAIIRFRMKPPLTRKLWLSPLGR